MDWKESFKERWFPEWLLQKYPVKYNYIKAKALYPLISVPTEQFYVNIQKYEGGLPHEER